MFIARQDLTTQDAEKLAEHFSSIIKELGGKILKTENWGLRTLAYKINKSRKGHYTLINFEAPVDAIAELERRYRLSEDIVRFLTLQVDSVSNEPSIVMKHSDGDSDRYAA